MAIAQLEFPRFKAFTTTGKLLSGGKVYVYQAGTSTKVTIWQDADKNSQHTNPVTLDSNGEAEIWFQGPVKIVLEDSNGVQQWTMDDIESDIPPTDVGRFNQVENGSFEIDEQDNDLPDDWVITTYDSTSTVEIDTTNVVHGSNSLKFVSQGAGGGTATTSDFFPVNSGRQVTVVFSIQSSVADVQNSVSVRWFDKDQTFISATTVYNENTNNPTSFEEKRFTAQAPSTATYAKLRLVGCDSADTTPGTTYFDDVKAYADEQAAVFSSSDVWEFSGTGGDVTASAADINRTTNGLVPGIIQMYGGSSEPSGWLLCSGQAVSRDTYSELFNVIGTTYGSGDGSTTFNVPDLRDRSPLGENSMGESDASRVDNYNTGLGDAGGDDQHQLSNAEMPSHNHGGGNHDHTLRATNFDGNTENPTGNVLAEAEDTSGNVINVYNDNVSPDTNMHGSSITNSGTIIDTNGSDNAHNNMHPFLALNFIIKT